MKNIILKYTILLLVAVAGGGGEIFAQSSKVAADSLEKVRLAQRSADFLAKKAADKRALQQRADLLQIPLQRTVGKKTYTLRAITPAGEPVYDAPDNLISIRTTNADNVKNGGGLGLALTGAGQTLGIWEAFDDGNAIVRTTHNEFGGRVTAMDGGGPSNHGTHVAGTMIAAGADTDAEGFSSGADLLSYDLNNDVAEMDAAAKAAVPVRITNHSYGSISGWSWNAGTMTWDWNGGGATEDWKFGAYNNDAREWDEVVFNNPFLAVFKSAGNDRGDGPGTNPPGALQDGGLLGYDCIPTYGNAKNIITVGAINDIGGGYTSPASVNMSSFSGWGPTDDGRIKPDIVANGVGLFSSVGTGDSDYDSYSGTSMSTPSAAGGAGLLLEHWGNVLGGVPRAATLKGLLIQMADEAGGTVGPDYSFGWGLVNVADAAEMITFEGYTGCQHYIEGSVANGDVFTHAIYSDGTSPLKITLTWTDVPSVVTNNGTVNPAGASYLVNNLDLRLDAPGGGTIFPWVLDPANPTNAAFAGDNNRDNVEQVLLLTPVAGVYTIRVVAPATVTDGPQRFTLWFSGNGAADEDLSISGVVINNNRTYAARRNIVFGPLPVTINSPANVKAYAGRSVRLQPGFHAVAGSRFLATILSGGGCGIWSGDLKNDNYGGSRPMPVIGGERQELEAAFAKKPAIALSLSPNPVSDILTAQWALDNPLAPVNIRIVDQRGSLVKQVSYSQLTIQAQLEISELAPGMYACIVDNGLQQVSGQFMVVR